MKQFLISYQSVFYGYEGQVFYSLVYAQTFEEALQNLKSKHQDMGPCSYANETID